MFINYPYFANNLLALIDLEGVISVTALNEDEVDKCGLFELIFIKPKAKKYDHSKSVKPLSLSLSLFKMDVLVDGRRFKDFPR